MSTFWIIYWICLAAVVVLSLVCVALFELDYEPISPAYAIIFDLIAAIPGIGMLGALILLVGLFVLIFEGDLTPKEDLFSTDKNE